MAVEQQQGIRSTIANGVRLFNNGSNSHWYKTIGICHVVFAVTAIVLELVRLSAGNVSTYLFLGTGLWSGVVYLPAGVVGILLGKRGGLCFKIAFMVLCIIAAVIAFIAFILHAVSAKHFDQSYCIMNHQYDQSGRTFALVEYRCVAIMRALSIISAFLALGVLVGSVLGSSLCCCSMCHDHEPGEHDTVACDPAAPPPVPRQSSAPPLPDDMPPPCAYIYLSECNSSTREKSNI